MRDAIGRLLKRAVPYLLRNVQPRVIYDQSGTSPYLSRYYLAGAPTMQDGSTPFDTFGNPKPEARWSDGSWGIYIHRFHRSDVDRELHNHPWRWAMSLILAGGYVEERRHGDEAGTYISVRKVQPLSLNFIGGDTFHRVDLIDGDAWSLFLVGPKVSSWGFWSRVDGNFTPWREFLSRKQGVA